MEKTIKKLTADIVGFTGDAYDKHVNYIETCLKIAYLQGSLDTGKIKDKFYRSIIKQRKEVKK